MCKSKQKLTVCCRGRHELAAGDEVRHAVHIYPLKPTLALYSCVIATSAPFFFFLPYRSALQFNMQLNNVTMLQIQGQNDTVTQIVGRWTAAQIQTDKQTALKMG